MGENLLKIANKLINNQKICRMLKYQDKNPFDEEKYADVNGIDLLHKQIIIIPKFPEEGIECSFVVHGGFWGCKRNKIQSVVKLFTHQLI